MKKKDCNCKPKKNRSKDSEIIIEGKYTKTELETLVVLVETKRNLSIEQTKEVFDLYNRIFSRDETNYNCGDCQKRVYRGLKYRLDEHNGKRKTK